jgi:MscS family membrane protein
MELWAYIKTGDWAQFTGIRQDVILKITEIVEASGTRFAAPTRLTYFASEGRVDAERAGLTQNRDSDSLPLASEARTGT